MQQQTPMPLDSVETGHRVRERLDLTPTLQHFKVSTGVAPSQAPTSARPAFSTTAFPQLTACHILGWLGAGQIIWTSAV